MRQLLCSKCGNTTPIPVEDILEDKVPRRTTGRLKIGPFYCDVCGRTLSPGDQVVAESLPSDMKRWEDDYLDDYSKDTQQ